MDKVTMKRFEMIELRKVLGNLPQITKVSVSLPIMESFTSIDAKVKEITAQIEPYEAHAAYDKELKALQEEHGEKDDKGNLVKVPVSKTVSNLVFAEPEVVEALGEKLKTKHKAAIDARNKQLEEYKEILDQDDEVELSLIDRQELYDDRIELDQQQLLSIRHIIKD